jgi:predicted dehydrogenase
VLVEKPLAGTREDCEALIEASARADRQIAVSQNYRYRPVMETARRVLASGELGEIGQAQVDFRIHHDFRGSFREHMEQPLILDMAVHSFDLIRFVTGLEMAEVQAHTWNPPWSQFEGDASAVALFTMDSGARIAYNGSWHPRGQFTDWNCRWLIECTGGYLTLDRDVVKVYRGDDVHQPGTAAEEETVPLVALERTDQAAVLVEFWKAIRDDRPAPTNAADNLRTVEMVLAAVESAIRAPVTG